MAKSLFIILVTPYMLYSQIDTTRLSFYPLHIGNEWTYQRYSYEYSSVGLDTLSIDTVLTKLTGDTIMPNGKKYYFMSGIYGGFRRIDSLALRVYQYDQFGEVAMDEYILFDLSIMDTLDWMDCFGNRIEISTTTSEEPVGYLNEKAVQTKYIGGYFYHYRVLSQRFGLSELHYGCMLPETIITLIGARINGIEYSSITNIHVEDLAIEYEFKLFSNSPNPFNFSTEIKYSLPQTKSSYHVNLKICDIRGSLVNTLVNQNQTAGTYSVRWNGRDMNGQAVSSGMYFYTLQADKFKATNKMLLIY